MRPSWPIFFWMRYRHTDGMTDQTNRQTDGRTVKRVRASKITRLKYAQISRIFKFFTSASKRDGYGSSTDRLTPVGDKRGPCKCQRTSAYSYFLGTYKLFYRMINKVEKIKEKRKEDCVSLKKGDAACSYSNVSDSLATCFVCYYSLLLTSRRPISTP